MEEPLTAKVAKKKHAKVAEIISLCVLGENSAYFAVRGFGFWALWGGPAVFGGWRLLVSQAFLWKSL
jgi:hypothetical protein